MHIHGSLISIVLHVPLLWLGEKEGGCREIEKERDEGG